MKSEIISFLIKNRINKINWSLDNPIDTQTEILNYLIKKAKSTKFGLDHKFNKINNYTSFKYNVPVRTYEEFLIYIEKCLANEKDIVWPGHIKWFAKSSGTTDAKSKYIPISKEFLYDGYIKAGKDMLSIYENNFSDKSIYKGKGLMLGGSLLYKEKYLIGDVSAILLNEFPAWVNYHRIPTLKTALLENWEIKLNKIVEESIDQNITNITGVPSWMLILLNKILEKSGAKNISEIWPNLEVYFHGGINFSPYQRSFNTIIGKEINYLEGYNASEGFFALQDQKKSIGLSLMLNNGVFYEFIPMNEYKKPNLDAVTLKHVKLNQKYVMVISTTAGLWRYIIGDVIEFTSIKPFRIKIIGRTKSFINTFGEELVIENTENAICNACEKHNCKVKEYTVGPVYIDKNSGGHEWLIEFEKKPKNLNAFMYDLDEFLKQNNSDYEAKRFNNIVIQTPKLSLIEKNEFYNWLQKNNRLGGQYKIPRLSNDRKLIDEILSM